MDKLERNETIYKMLKSYGCMSIKSIIKRFNDDYGYKMIDNQVHDFIFEYKSKLHLETIKTRRTSKYLIGRKDMLNG